MGREDPLEESMATHSSIPAWRIPWTERGLVGYSRGKESDTTEHTHTQHVDNRVHSRALTSAFNSFNSPNTLHGRHSFPPTLHMRELGCKEFKEVSQTHSARKWQSQDSNL